MDFTLDKQHEMARQLFKDFAVNEAKPLGMKLSLLLRRLMRKKSSPDPQ